ncbi:MAG: hypothetical protein Q7S40_15790 [Opitutaceae bacterium]|nr:hypothetical protein [Opitutaceae bacterium]
MAAHLPYFRELALRAPWPADVLPRGAGAADWFVMSPPMRRHRGITPPAQPAAGPGGAV